MGKQILQSLSVDCNHSGIGTLAQKASSGKRWDVSVPCMGLKLSHSFAFQHQKKLALRVKQALNQCQ